MMRGEKCSKNSITKSTPGFYSILALSNVNGLPPLSSFLAGRAVNYLKLKPFTKDALPPHSSMFLAMLNAHSFEYQ